METQSNNQSSARKNCIRLRGAREHNLKGLDIEIPREVMTVITGVSGSGKSSLAFDTLFAEGYRKYMDSLSTRARQLLAQMPRPEYDTIEGLTPVIAIEQRTGGGVNPRSTVASVTEIADYARLLWAMAGVAYCPVDGGRIRSWSLDDAIEKLLAEAAGARVQILAPYIEGPPSLLRGELPHLRQRGYQRVRVAGEIQTLDDDRWLPRGRGVVQLDIVIDRLVARAGDRSRLADSLELAFREGDRRAIALIEREGQWVPLTLSLHHACEDCGAVYAPVRSRMFSWDHPEGACPCCGGLGDCLQFAPELVVPDTDVAVRNGAIKPWRLGSKRMIIERNAMLKQLAEQVPFDPTVPWAQLPETVRDGLMRGFGEREFAFKLRAGNRKPALQQFAGVLADLEQTRKSTRSEGLRARLMAYQTRYQCPECHGQRLNAHARAVRLAGQGYADFLALPLNAALAFCAQLTLPGFEEAVSGLRRRIEFLNRVGLGYLRLDRSYASLSGGEAQRVRLATQLGMGLVGVTYVLDEPTIGLHPSDTAALLDSVRGLRDAGNTVILVEHDPDVIRAADHLIEIGPGAGEAGGYLIYQGTVADAAAQGKSKTGAYLSGRRQVERFVERKAPGAAWIEIRGAREHNLKDIDVRLPCGLLTVVTGVSGSGKSTLVNKILGSVAAVRLNRAKEIPGRHAGLRGLENFERLVRVDQDGIGRSPRSNPATYTKLMDALRKIYAATPLAKIRGYGPGRFSFNVRGGRCERCQGDGLIQLDMQFLSDVYTVCPSCDGKRFNRETLEVRFKGLSIADVLELNVEQALPVFGNQPQMRGRLETLRAVGLGYLRLGQSAPTLSGGEAQRLKLALELSKGQQSSTLYILDEPTTGLHWEDIQMLMDLLFRLRERGHTLVLIEHNLDVIRLADWVVDLGPSGGDAGGECLYSGPLEGLYDHPRSKTAAALAALGSR